MQLPIMASPEDMSKVAKYLSTKVSGCTLDDAKAALDNRLVDARKINAYISWGMLIRDAEKLRLSERGKRLAKAQNTEEVQTIYQEIIRDIEAYNGVIEWLCYNNTPSMITNVEVAEYWHDTKKYDMFSENDNTLKDRAVCFFKVCEAAGIGKLYVGRRGQSTRLEFNMEIIRAYLANVNATQEGENAISENLPVAEIQEPKQTENMVTVSSIQFPIPFVDGRCAYLHMPQNADKKDAQYIFDMLHLILSRQYGLDE